MKNAGNICDRVGFRTTGARGSETVGAYFFRSRNGGALFRVDKCFDRL